MRSFAVASLCLVRSSSALQRYTPLSSMVMFGNTKALLITRTEAGLTLDLLIKCRFSWRQSKHHKRHCYNLWWFFFYTLLTVNPPLTLFFGKFHVKLILPLKVVSPVQLRMRVSPTKSLTRSGVIFTLLRTRAEKRQEKSVKQRSFFISNGLHFSLSRFKQKDKTHSVFWDSTLIGTHYR